MPVLTLRLVPGSFAVCRLDPITPVPAWAQPVGAAFSSVTRTAAELSIICPAESVPAAVRAERDWALIEFVGPFDFGAIGILASVTQPLATAGVSVLAVGTFDTDYVLVKRDRLAAARSALTAAGHRFIGE